MGCTKSGLYSKVVFIARWSLPKVRLYVDRTPVAIGLIGFCHKFLIVVEEVTFASFGGQTVSKLWSYR